MSCCEAKGNKDLVYCVDTVLVSFFYLGAPKYPVPQTIVTLSRSATSSHRKVLRCAFQIARNISVSSSMFYTELLL